MKLSHKKQNLLGCFLIGGILVIVFCVFGAWRFYNSFPGSSFQQKDIPAEIRDARIIIGAEFLSKSEFFKQKTQNLVQISVESFQFLNEQEREVRKNSEIAKGIYGFADLKFNRAGNEIIAVGRFGAEILSRDGKLKREILFEPTIIKRKSFFYELNDYRQDFTNYKIVDLENDGRFEYLAYAGFDGAAVFNDSGAAVWRYGRILKSLSDALSGKNWEEVKQENPMISGATVGDLDGDGVAEIVFTQSSDEILAFDVGGNERWRQKDEIPGDSLWTADLDNDGKAEIIELFFSKPIVRNSAGNIIKELKIDYQACDDILLSDSEAGRNKKMFFLGFGANKLHIADESEKKIRTAEAPLSEIKRDKPLPKSTPIRIDGDTIAVPMDNDNTEKVHTAKAIKVKLQRNAPDYLAVVAPYILLNRSIFYVYDDSGKLVYQEVLPETSETITTLPGDDGIEEILIGGKETIWRYSAK